MDTAGEFGELIRLASQGDEVAVRQLLRSFEPHVRRIVRRRLPRTMRPQYDSTDFTQAVWDSFLRVLYRSSASFSTPLQLSHFLAELVTKKIVSEFHRHVSGSDSDSKGTGEHSPEPDE